MKQIIRLVDVDSKIPNLALMKISAWHKLQGDNVDFYNPIADIHVDKIYANKTFQFSQDFDYYPVDTDISRGGVAYDRHVKLPDEIDAMFPDYSLYNCNMAIGYTMRGCIRNCSFCVVPEMEGLARPVGDIYNFWNGQKELMLLDNNLTALPEHFQKVIGQIIKEEIYINFAQGLDIRLIDASMAKMLAMVKTSKQIHFAFDDIKYENAVKKGIEILIANGVKPYKLMFFVLIGFNSTPEEDLYRVGLLRKLGVDPFVMPFNKKVPYQQAFARWVNMKAVFKKCNWREYRKKIIEVE